MRACLCFSWACPFALLFPFFRFLSSTSPTHDPVRCNGGKVGATALVLAAMFRAVPPRLARHSDRSFLRCPVSHPLSPPLLLIFPRYYRPVYRTWARVRPGTRHGGRWRRRGKGACLSIFFVGVPFARLFPFFFSSPPLLPRMLQVGGGVPVVGRHCETQRRRQRPAEGRSACLSSFRLERSVAIGRASALFSVWPAADRPLVHLGACGVRVGRVLFVASCGVEPCEGYCGR